jgi:hypothetical protein
MELLTIDIIKEKLNHIPDRFSQDIIDYLDFITYKQHDGFVLTERHLELLEVGDRTPIEKCKPLDEFMSEIRQKYQ